MNKKTAIVRTVSAALLSALICLASCQSPFEPEENLLPGETVTEVLELEFGDPAAFTKVGITSATGQFSWTDGDQVAVWYQNGASGAWSSASISANSLTVSGTGSRAKLAVYPYGAQTNFNLTAQDNATYPVTKIRYASEIDLTGKDKDYAPVPMIALNDPTRNGLKFYHVGGLIRFRLHGIPAGTRYIRISSDAAPLCGDFPVAIPTGNEINAAELVYSKSRWCTLYDENSWDSLFGSTHGQSVLVKITDDALTAETDDITINLPVPMGVYNKLTVQAIASDGTTDLTPGGGSAYERADKAVVWECDRATATHLQNLALRPDHHITNPKYVPGKFSVAPGKQVWFASGNLVVTYRSNGQHEWAFEENQYDYSYGNGGRSVDVGYQQDGVRISHFGWATAGVKNNGGDYAYDPHHVNYMPYDLEVIRDDYEYFFADNVFGYGPSVSDYSSPYWATVYGANIPSAGAVHERLIEINNTWNRDGLSTSSNSVRKYCDWGVHFNDAGVGSHSTTDGSWYTLSMYEWDYLIRKRTNSTVLIAQGSIWDVENNTMVPGTIILPDDWTTPPGCKLRPGEASSYTANVYILDDNDNGEFDGLWATMEAAGAVFLPAAGSRVNRVEFECWGFANERKYGTYWSASACKTGSGAGDGAIYAYFSADYNVVDMVERYTGCCVRLVHD